MRKTKAPVASTNGLSSSTHVSTQGITSKRALPIPHSSAAFSSLFFFSLNTHSLSACHPENSDLHGI